jgi:hypothetical protein
MSGPVGILGIIPFVGGLGSTFTVHEIQKKRKNAFAKHRVINGNDLIEDVGFDPIELDLSMKFFAPWTSDPSLSLIALEGLMDLKIPVPLIIGGTPVGRGFLTLFVIESIDSKMEKWDGGKLLILECTVKLLEYGNPFNISGPLGILVQAGASVVGNLI